MNRKVILSSIIDIISGGTPKTSIDEYWTNGDIGWLSVNDFNNDLRFVYDSEKKITQLGVKNSNTKYLNIGDLIISARGTVGALAQIARPMCFNQSCFGIRGKQNVAYNDYLYYALKNYVTHIKQRSQGSVFDTINLASFDLMEIEIPSYKTQQKIAKVLSTLDKKIELNNQINQNLEAMAKTLYDYWFVQFDFPFDSAHGKPNANGKPYKSSGGKMVYSEEMKREIPEGWEVKELGEVASIIAGGDKPKNFSKEQTDMYTIPIFSNGIQNEGLYGFTDKARITKQSITISARGTIGYCVLRNESYVPIIRLISVTPNLEKTAVFLYHSIKNLVFENSGSVQQQLTVPQISTLNIVIPTNLILEKFEEITFSMVEKLENIKDETQKLTQLRDWLLPMLMNGQVSVADATEQVEELMVAEPSVEYGA